MLQLQLSITMAPVFLSYLCHLPVYPQLLAAAQAPPYSCTTLGGQAFDQADSQQTKVYCSWQAALSPD